MRLKRNGRSTGADHCDEQLTTFLEYRTSRKGIATHRTHYWLNNAWILGQISMMTYRMEMPQCQVKIQIYVWQHPYEELLDNFAKFGCVSLKNRRYVNSQTFANTWNRSHDPVWRPRSLGDGPKGTRTCTSMFRRAQFEID